jgi:hypothetical protein
VAEALRTPAAVPVFYVPRDNTSFLVINTVHGMTFTPCKKRHLPIYHEMPVPFFFVEANSAFYPIDKRKTKAAAFNDTRRSRKTGRTSQKAIDVWRRCITMKGKI